mmetsp:Transcript_41341/g.54371  ORF Transcript_41341/g.54371 Transcript_41341/m.54371 type:complete len:169 (-) Transcript_41341:861-1367(-)|eukprot:CAMPEP_0185624098 /NCGR_PEP_ID=MMETSP0436-20130131/60360_1 /TAXON_ID=626734 ORGANISM="Favella taraikaensis, Strain Fe Narragansett Bay" /NCGR_SAMPLE_ID=MMETSP0436 /ASSEMBLY_ACC=CAM_ASM_000390 /LENGTH=168 /DNA_ID=CAMNT_0028266455 /DNA_START=1211 /DNA_END=1717 /DNA_ORIENTATION=-
MVVSQLKAGDKPGDNSEIDNNLIDAETRGGNLSSHGESKHYGTQSAGFNQSSIVGGHMTSGPEAGPPSAVKGHFLNAQTCWESDTSNSVMQAQFSGLHVLKKPGGVNFTSSPGVDLTALRTDDEMNGRRNLNQTEIARDGHAEDEVVNDFRDTEGATPLPGNWSDNGG